MLLQNVDTDRCATIKRATDETEWQSTLAYLSITNNNNLDVSTHAQADCYEEISQINDSACASA